MEEVTENTEARNVAHLTSDETRVAINEYLQSKDLSQLSHLHIALTTEGLEFDACYHEALPSTQFRGLPR